MSGAVGDAVLLVSHGTVDDLDDLGAFVTNVRRGRPAPPELVSELRRRYEAIGGSPLNAVNAEVARKLKARLGGETRVALANRLWKPSVQSVFELLAESGVKRVAVVALAQHSGHVYAEDAQHAAAGTGVALSCAPSWGRRADLCAAYASRITASLDASPDPSCTTLLMTAHSLPRSVVDGGDPYEGDVRAAADQIHAVVRAHPAGSLAHADVAFQSHGPNVSLGGGPGARSIPWLGPDLLTAIQRARARGDRHVLVAPIGFLADHMEVLYDLDVEARAMADALGLSYARTPSLNASDDFVEILARIATSLLEGLAP